ncbi:AraC family transcriptional regulator [Flavobacterium sp. UBA4854]|uniref:AraC family transcriptional regulator n=1 Tax=Flavobacterium sp. UBA4854 TaxID=1946548 RepID=UPI00257A9FA6|nr:AraC family transcriptional regulator [Flavobacterium sp. UBA4854]
MQNANSKCGLSEPTEGQFLDNISTNAYVWYDQNWQHDEYLHTHERYQLTYVEEGYQYFHIEEKTYLVPQNHVIWIPTKKEHRISSESKTVNLIIALFKSVPTQDFFQNVHVFSAPNVLKEMILYAQKWDKLLTENEEQANFLKAILTSLPNFCKENNALQIPVPADDRLIPVCNYINKNYQYAFEIDELANLAQMSVRSLQRIFKQKTNITLQKYLQLIRILKSIELLDAKQYTLSQIAHLVGYKSLSAFSASYFNIIQEKPKLRK